MFIISSSPIKAGFMPKRRIEIPEKEFEEKRFTAAKDILAGALTHEKIEAMGDSIQRQAVVFNCISIADTLLEELGYARKVNPDHTTVRNLKDILKDDK